MGHDADFTVVDRKADREFLNDWIASKCGWTPYDGFRTRGRAVGTIIREARVMWEDELVAQSRGAPAKFQEGWTR